MKNYLIILRYFYHGLLKKKKKNETFVKYPTPILLLNYTMYNLIKLTRFLYVFR